MRLLFWFALFVLVVMAIRKKVQPVSRSPQEPVVEQNPFAKTDEVESMVCCVHCQVYLPASDAIYRGEHAYCSTAHADLH